MTELQNALTRIGGLSGPAKMPCSSWSIPAQTCQLGALLAKRKGSTCFGCYALKGMYVMPNVKTAMARRYELLTEALANPLGPVAFRDAFAYVLNYREASQAKRVASGRKRGKKDHRFFRWHDSGDLQSPEHLLLLFAIAERTPKVTHWLPTREAGHVAEALTIAGEAPKNFRIRLSTPNMDAAPSGLALKLSDTFERVTHSGVHTSEDNRKAMRAQGVESRHEMRAQACPAYTQDGECRDCRRCWSTAKSHEFISYPKH